MLKEETWDRIFDWAVEKPFIVWLWSWLPPRCEIDECPRELLRWTENIITVLSGPETGRELFACDHCCHRLRQASFKAGASVHHIDDNTVEYRPPD